MTAQRFKDRPITFANGATGQVITIASANPGNYYQMLNDPQAMPRVDVDGQLFMPPNATTPVPLVIVVPGSLSVAPSHLAHAEAFTNSGIASFVLDPFGARGVTSTVANQAQFSFAASAYDVMAAARQLAMLEQIDASRIALLGHSRGGSAVLNAAMRRLNAPLFKDTFELRAVLAAYPWCGHQPLDPDVGGTRVHVLIGEQDDWVSPQQAQGLVHAMQVRGAAATIRIVALAQHSFDRREPLQRIEEASVSPHAPTAYLANDGAFIHPITGKPDPELMDRDLGVYALKAGFGRKGATIGSQGDQATLFHNDMIAFFEGALRPS
jgi:dienelactone hydrolase